jgi:GxxExxY protein
MSENEIAKRVLDSGFVVHTKLGPGLLESVYEVVLAHELEKNGLKVERQKPMPIVYDGKRFDEAYRADLVIDSKVIVELKSVEAMAALHAKQVLTPTTNERPQARSVDQFWRSSLEKWNQTVD